MWRLVTAAIVLGLGLSGMTPAAAQMQMPDARQMSGLPIETADLPDGSVSVRVVRAQLSDNVSDVPVELHGPSGTLAARTDASGRAQFDKLAAGARFHAFALVDGERLESQDFDVPSSGGIRVMLVAGVGAPGPGAGHATVPAVPGTVVIGGDSRFVLEFDDDQLEVFYLFEFVNRSDAPVSLSSPLVIQMPPNAAGTTVMRGSSPQAAASGTRVTVSGPFQPGTTQVQTAYVLPIRRGSMTVRQPLPAALEQLRVIVEKAGGVSLSSPQIASQGDMTTQGHDFTMATGPGIAAGGELELHLSGLRYRSSAPLYGALALSGFILGAGIWGASASGRPGRDARRAGLEARREKLMATLVSVEQQYRAGRMERERYASRRSELLAQIERVHGELDVREGGAPGAEGPAT
jgi:hypothetical protein